MDGIYKAAFKVLGSLLSRPLRKHVTSLLWEWCNLCVSPLVVAVTHNVINHN